MPSVVVFNNWSRTRSFVSSSSSSHRRCHSRSHSRRNSSSSNSGSSGTSNILQGLLFFRYPQSISWDISEYKSKLKNY